MTKKELKNIQMEAFFIGNEISVAENEKDIIRRANLYQKADTLRHFVFMVHGEKTANEFYKYLNIGINGK